MLNFITQHGLTHDIDAVLNNIKSANKAQLPATKVAIVAGHYCLASQLSDLSNEGEAEIFSFKLGVTLYQQLMAINQPAQLILWVNDIGISTEQRQQIKSSYQIPANYAAILAQANIDLTAIEVIFESASRNKASTLLRQRIKQAPQRFEKYDSDDPALIRCIDSDFCAVEKGKTVYAIAGPEGAPLVMKEGNNPKCNLILATLFFRIAQAHPPLIFVNVFNDIYIERIRLGMYVAQQVYQLPNHFINLFCDDDSFYQQDFTFAQQELADAL